MLNSDRMVPWWMPLMQSLRHRWGIEGLLNDPVSSLRHCLQTMSHTPPLCVCVYQMRTNRASHVLFPWFRMSCQLKSRETGVEWGWLKHGMPDSTNCLQDPAGNVPGTTCSTGQSVCMCPGSGHCETISLICRILSCYPLRWICWGIMMHMVGSTGLAMIQWLS